MIKIPLTVHMVLKNEDRFIWYALRAILPYADRVLVTDTGSTDNTIQIINKIGSSKIFLEKETVSSPMDISRIRDSQLKKTKTDWMWIVDGDEIYPRKTVFEIQSILSQKADELEGIAVSRYDLLGDIYHFQGDSAGYYDLFGKRGHFAVRLLNTRIIKGLHVQGSYPLEGYYDDKKSEIIHHNPQKFQFTQNKLFHAMYLQRSSSGSSLNYVYHRDKYKVEIGEKVPESDIPEVLYQERPDYVEEVTGKRSTFYETAASLITPIKMLKRKMCKI